MTESSGATQDASRRYAALVLNGPPGEFTRESAFRAGFVLLEGGDARGALNVWQSLVGAETARLEYWRGRALTTSGDRAGATAAYERAVALGPLDLHGLEAARELGRAPRFDVSYVKRDLTAKIDWPAISSWLSGRVGSGPAGTPPTAACELAGAGLQSAAAAEIEAAERRDDAWRTFELMREASECGLTNIAAQLAVALRIAAGVQSNEPPAELLRVSYPLDYVSTLDAEARKANVDPLFLASLIRQESFWEPSARSAANAFGLTQVIPPTGAALAAELGVDDFEPEMLLGPALSIEFGAHYLAGQIIRYGNPLYALSAYNAGPGNAARWQASGAVQAADIVEVVDFVETRSYVTFIYEAYAHYQLAWGR